jgi:hypothetical protein
LRVISGAEKGRTGREITPGQQRSLENPP